MRYYADFRRAVDGTRDALLEFGQPVDAGHWQGVPTEGKEDLKTIELMDWEFSCPVPDSRARDKPPTEHLINTLALDIRPNLPWADQHFYERVSRKPTNPGEAYRNWPWWHGQDQAYAADIPGFQFTHTYQERFWPKMAAGGMEDQDDVRHGGSGIVSNYGIRYDYGDLDDVVQLLLAKPYTRQAYLPIFFPEDTGAVHGGRIPCTLGYYFLFRNNELNLWYIIRSCDLVRHFQDDVYLACRLLLWVLDELKERELRADIPQTWVDVDPGIFHFKCFSLHYHKGDQHLVKQIGTKGLSVPTPSE